MRHNLQTSRRHRRHARWAVLLTVAALTTMACSNGDSDKPAAGDSTIATTKEATVPSGANIAITIKGFIFQPADVTVKAGTTITWTNQDDILHTATSGVPAGTPDNRFHGEMAGKNKSFSVKLDQPGTYEYFCSRHNSMTGKIIVAP